MGHVAVAGRSKERLEEYERRTSPAMVVLSLLFIAIYAVQVLVVRIDHRWQDLLAVVNVLIWLCFVADLGIRLWLAPRRLSYAVRHPLDVVAVIIPAFRSLRVLRVFTAGQWLLNRGTNLAVGRTMLAIAVAAASIAFVGSLAVLDAERYAPGASILTFGDAVWWSAETMSTVGYGDVYPVTTTGRIVGVAMMVIGVSFLGVVTATVASWFVARLSQSETDENAAVVAELREIKAELAALRAAGRPADPSTGSA